MTNRSAVVGGVRCHIDKSINPQIGLTTFRIKAAWDTAFGPSGMAATLQMDTSVTDERGEALVADQLRHNLAAIADWAALCREELNQGGGWEIKDYPQ